MNKIRIVQWILVILLSALALVDVSSRQGLIFPIGLLAFMYRESLMQLSNRISFPLAYFVTGLFFGILTEVFAILGNLNLPTEQKVLLNQQSTMGDLSMGVVWYGLFLFTWYVLLQKINFSKRTVFIASGLFGILTENSGSILFGIIASPILGTILALMIGLVYAIFSYLAYLLTEHRFPIRNNPSPHHYALIPLFFFLFWAVYGNIIHPFLLSIKN